MTRTRALAVSDSDLGAVIAAHDWTLPAARRGYFAELAARVFGAAARLQRALPPLQFAYSVKTNPRTDVLKTAHSNGLFAECISEQELQAALEAGFPPTQLLYNGPLPAWQNAIEPGWVFADSLEAFQDNLRFARAVPGIRIRPDGIESRFGLTRADAQQAAAIVARSGRDVAAVSFHVRPQDYGGRNWREIALEGLRAAQLFQATSGAAVIAFDVGGGKTPAEFDQAVREGDFVWLRRTARALLPALQVLFAEPGQALATPLEAVAARVVEVRNRQTHVEAIVDAGYPEVTQITAFQHRLYRIEDAGAVRLTEGGRDRVCGRTCLEYDIIANDVALPETLRAGDLLIIADAGAYDSSMQFTFARGRRGNNCE